MLWKEHHHSLHSQDHHRTDDSHLPNVETERYKKSTLTTEEKTSKILSMNNYDTIP